MTDFKICLLLLSLSTLSNGINILPTEVPEDAKLNFTGLASKYGHPAEEHEIITEDGYILALFRLPNRNSGNTARRTPILLIHGTGDYADTFLMRGNKSLGIALANANYDVWVPNFRGSRYSRRHITLNPDTDPKFWDYGFHERGYTDLAETIDYVLNVTGETSVITIGMSQGTSNHFVLLSTRPEYNQKIKLYIAIAPVAYLNHIPPRVALLTKIGPLINEWAIRRGYEHIAYENVEIPNFNELKCGLNPGDLLTCKLLSILYLYLFDPKTIEPEFYQVLLGHYPETTTRKNLFHYNQIALSKNFSQYDYGPEENLRRYGNIVPPEYDLRKVTVKTALLLGKQDELATIKDAEILRKVLPNVIFHRIMKPKDWNHVHFIWRNDMDVHLFPIIFDLLEKNN